MVGSLHGNRDIGDSLIYRLIRTGQESVGINDLAATLIRCEVVVPIHADEATETLSHVQNLEFCPQVHQTVCGRGTGKAHNAPDPWPHLHKCFETL